MFIFKYEAIGTYIIYKVREVLYIDIYVLGICVDGSTFRLQILNKGFDSSITLNINLYLKIIVLNKDDELITINVIKILYKKKELTEKIY
jgi:hypothetical protein